MKAKDFNLNDKQNIEQRRSEILFREKLARQHVQGEELINGYISKKEHDQVMKERVTTTAGTMKDLQNKGVQLSPFIEVGAERGQRSLVLTNDFNAEGFAVDLSYAQLQTMDYWKKFFDKSKCPIRVCCDIYHLPFQQNSLNFAFCYQFLHHFPTPGPIIKEIHRVLASGHLYFDEEPYKRFSLKLYRRKISNKPGKLKRYLEYIESFIAEQYETEEEYGIIENDEIPLKEWLNVLEIFDEKKVYLKSIDIFVSEVGKSSALKIRLHKMLGGGISALLKKETNYLSVTDPVASGTMDIYNILGCPVCIIATKEDVNGPDRSPLIRHQDYLKCDSCKKEYPIVDNVMFLLPPDEMKELYPQFVR